jgi:hypothetical protein
MAQHGGKADLLAQPIPYSSWQINYYWHKITKDQWSMDPDAFTSARMLIETLGADFHTKLMDLQGLPPGTRALAFTLEDFLGLFHSSDEVAMDSTCK